MEYENKLNIWILVPVLGITLLVLGIPALCGAVNLDKPILTDRPELPKLPDAFSRSRSNGMIMLKVHVDAHGAVDQVEPIKGSGWDLLDQYLVEWVLGWRYIPKVSAGAPVASYTVQTIRYDLGRKQFEAPKPLTVAVQLPDAVIESMNVNSNENTKRNLPSPMTPLSITSIPIEIQKLAISGLTEFHLTVDSKGAVSDVSVNDTVNEEFRNWLVEYLKSTRWDDKSKGKIIIQPVEYNTTICKITFNSPRIQ